MTISLARLIAKSNLHILALSKRKSAMAPLFSLMGDEGTVSPPRTGSVSSTKGTFTRHRRSRSARLSNVCPGVCVGEISLQGVTFTHAAVTLGLHDVPREISPLTSDWLMAGSNEIQISSAEIVPWLKRLSVTVGISALGSLGRVPAEYRQPSR